MAKLNFKDLLDSLPEMSLDEAAILIAESEVVDRYSACGIPYPDPATMCFRCEGMGFFPVKNDDHADVLEIAAWMDAHTKPNAHDEDGGKCDGWHFINCFECLGTRKRISQTEN